MVTLRTRIGRIAGRGLLALTGAASLAAAQPAPAAARGPVPRPIAGRTIDGAGRAVPLAQVTTGASMGRSDSLGRFMLRPVSCDTLRIAARRLGYRPARAVLAPCAAARDDTLRLVLAALPPRLATDTVNAELSGVRGMVVDAQGDGIPDAEVTLFTSGRTERGRTAITAGDGSFALLDVAAGGALLRVRHRAFQQVQRAVTFARADLRELTVRMSPLGNLPERRAGFGDAEWPFIDLERRQRYRATASLYLSRDQLLAVGESQLHCAITRVPGVLSRLQAGVRNVLTLDGGCLPPNLCVIADGVAPIARALWSIRPEDVEFVEVYTGDFQVRTVNTRGCTPPMVVVWSN
ncbi:MAG: carboxypeptidase-like regulatory domain-containing protein [Gemmatimonadaceae bacterium]|nr:carboxypeptidase-like regulatory domain-containing protein [Gemmatimonadaceae bacterium]